MRLNDLDVALRNGGIGHWIDPGWRTRGPAMSGLRAIMVHHTAGGGVNDWRVVRDGRPGLAGPLSHMTLERDGGVRLLASGRCNHAGTGSHPRVGTNNGNQWTIGIEGVSPGQGNNIWTAAQRREYPRLCAALCRHYNLPAAVVIGHKEWAPNRKIDPADWNMNAFRASVQAHLNEEDELRDDERSALFDIREQLIGSRAVGTWSGWQSWRYDEAGKEVKATLVDYIRAIDQNLNTRFTLDGRPAARADDTGTGHLLSLRAEVKALGEKLDAILEDS